MCVTCGCGSVHGATPYSRAARPTRTSSAAKAASEAEGARLVRIEQDILSENNAQAALNRTRLLQRGVSTINLLSSPGSGKTSLLVETIQRLRGRLDVRVIEGDQQTDRDAARIRETGAPVVQINTGKGCHLDAQMVARGLDQLDAAHGVQTSSLLMIENVGNLVCPAAFDLGETHKVVLLSVTEGDDKPLKYADMFAVANRVIISKIDLLPYVEFDLERASRFARSINPDLQIMTLSVRSGEGMDRWLDWLIQLHETEHVA
jgi:hydrogenase nickel incorporation protein HypB